MTFFIGPIWLRMALVHQPSTNFTAHSALVYSRNRWKSSRSR